MSVSLSEGRIGVVVPTRGTPWMLAECLLSLQSSIGVDWVCLVVVDGLIDAASIRIAEAFSRVDSRIRVVAIAASGLPTARNVGIRRLLSDNSVRFIFPLDSDNVLGPRTLLNFREVLDSASDAAWAYPDLRTFRALRGYGPGLTQFPDRWSRAMLVSRNFCDAGSLVRREVFDAGLKYPASQSAGYEDWSFFLRAAETFRGTHAGDVGFHYRVHQSSLSAELRLAGERTREREVLQKALNVLPPRVRLNWLTKEYQVEVACRECGLQGSMTEGFGTAVAQACSLAGRIDDSSDIDGASGSRQPWLTVTADWCSCGEVSTQDFFDIFVDACLLIRELGARQLTFHHRTVGAVTLEPQLGACTAVEPGGSNGKRVDGPAASLQTGLEAGCIPVPWEAESDYSIALVGASPVSAVRMARTLSENGRGPHMLLAVPGSRRIGMQTRAPQVSRATWLLGGGGVLIEICTRVVCAFVDVESMSQELIARLVEQGLPVYGYIDSHELLPRGYVSILHHAKLLSGVLVPEGDVAQVLLGLDLGNARLHQYATRRDLLSTMEALVAESRRRGTHEY